MGFESEKNSRKTEIFTCGKNVLVIFRDICRVGHVCGGIQKRNLLHRSGSIFLSFSELKNHLRR